MSLRTATTFLWDVFFFTPILHTKINMAGSLQKPNPRGPSLSFVETSPWTPLRDRLGPAQGANLLSNVSKVISRPWFPRYQWIISQVLWGSNFEIHPIYSQKISWNHLSEELLSTAENHEISFNKLSTSVPQKNTTISKDCIKTHHHSTRSRKKNHWKQTFQISYIFIFLLAFSRVSNLELPFWQ